MNVCCEQGVGGVFTVVHRETDFHRCLLWNVCARVSFAFMGVRLVLLFL
jgi:hypothetical protein